MKYSGIFQEHINLWTAALVSVAIHFYLLFTIALSPPSHIDTSLHTLTVHLPQSTQQDSMASSHIDPINPLTSSTTSLPAESRDEKPVDVPPPNTLIEVPDPGISDIQIPTDLYRAPRDVEEPAHVTHIEIWQPPESSNEINGKLVLRIYVNEDGKANHIEYEINDLPNYFTKQIADSFMLATYSPGFWGGKPIKSWMKVEIAYSAGNLSGG